MGGDRGFDAVVAEVIGLLEAARSASARSVNSILTATYWAIGRRIVEEEQAGRARAGYGEELIDGLVAALTSRFGRGFGRSNLFLMRSFFLEYRARQVPLAARLGKRARKVQTPFGQLEASLPQFPLPWGHYTRLLALKGEEARAFYEAEALRGGWTVRQLERQIATDFFGRTRVSKEPPALSRPRPEKRVTSEDGIRDPYILEFLGLKRLHSENDLEDALIRQLESFLLELGGDFTFVGRQRRCRIGGRWYRIDLLLFHRRLRCLVIIDLKLNGFTPGDIGQMNFYLNYAREHWTLPDEKAPVGLILSAEQNAAVAQYAFEGVANNILAAEYRTSLPDEQRLTDQINKTRRLIEAQRRPK